MAMDAVLATDESSQILRKISIGRLPIRQRPQYNGKINHIGRPTSLGIVTYLFFPLVSVICRLLVSFPFFELISFKNASPNPTYAQLPSGIFHLFQRCQLLSKLLIPQTHKDFFGKPSSFEFPYETGNIFYNCSSE